MKDSKIIIDLDNTITIENPSISYENKDKNLAVAKALKKIKKENIVIFSSRNMRTFNNDLEKINEVTKPIIEKWLNENEVNYGELILGKPWCGEEGFYIDDKNLSIEEFLFKFDGPFSENDIDVIIPFYNEEKNVFESHQNQLNLEKLFNIKNFIYINNGSSDKTLENLNEIAKKYRKIKVIDIKKNLGYGNGIKKGLELSESDFILINHGDLQFDSYDFFRTNLSNINPKTKNIFSKRLNRSFLDSFCSMILRIIISIICLHKVKDFNGQPKIFNKDLIENINSFPDDFTFDLYLYFKTMNDVQFLPIIERIRKFESSSWSRSLIKRISIFLSYISRALKK